ncbi:MULTISPECIES: hypothetical protein [unclassified Methanosarcina]|uniref:hypothetical protein n=1 Tax=unclassified Methanosarcina TaxID=2644672 RepID=UPI000615C882|nr:MULTISPECIES: hypothetical protein [unclassified Methanosarcina]AKB18232.1 Alcohol dehydrogenase [Methanosarcina sp. WWM596]AKB21557.1 Alcohol dehydrogenase [Methanosarcina sp. WH1]
MSSFFIKEDIRKILEAADKAIDAIKKIAADIVIPSGLKELGAREEDLELLAEKSEYVAGKKAMHWY